MIKTKSVIEIKIGDRSYSMECNADSPLGEVHDALIQMKSVVIGLMRSHADQEKKETENAKDKE